MPSQDSTQPTVSEVLPASASVDIEADSTLGYASIQNAIPVVRSLTITNTGSEALEGVEVLITCNPRFAQGTKLRFDRLAPGETRRISPVDLVPEHDYLANLQEAVQAILKVWVVVDKKQIGQAVHTFEVLAYDQWPGTRALPELLAAFCMPNNPVVDGLLGKASKLLRSEFSALSMDGYQSKSRDVVWKQVSAIYSTIAAEQLQYAEPPASFGTGGQKIRSPDRILEGRVATCLDLAICFAACLEQAGLRPVILLKEAHAWVGVWLHATCFPDPITDDVQAIRKRVETGEFLVIEATGLAQHPNHRPSLRIAMEQGAAHLLDGDAFRYAVDIHRAREVQIKPLPSRAASIAQGVAGTAGVPPAIEPTPPLPPLDPVFLPPVDLPGDETPDGRLAKWKSKLLDLTLRNRLLNFKPTKLSLQLVAPDLPKLEDALADGSDFLVRPLPPIMDGNDPRMSSVHTLRAGRTPVDEMALEALEKHELLARLPGDKPGKETPAQEVLNDILLGLHAAARTGLEEGGANTLFLALGQLCWADTPQAESTHLAPILLIPVTLERQSVRSGFRLRRHDDETIVNPTLMELLKRNFELRIPALDVLPMDDKGVDVARVLQEFRLAVRSIAGWEVLEQATLAIFSFSKFLMWKDLQDRAEQLKQNVVVKHLIEHAGEAFPFEGDGPSDRLDEAYGPKDILAPLLADSSQLKAICAVDGGRNLVLEGPPGTGKSQTITNLIAHTLAKGKSVLFVSEKMAALEVVHRRLQAIGLGPFCLELHSSKAKKSEVVHQLGRALDVTAQRTADDWNREAERLAQYRQELNGLVEALHREHKAGLTVFDAIGTCIEHEGERPSQMPWTDALTHSRAELDVLRELVSRISTLRAPLGPLSGHPLANLDHTEWSPSWQDELLDVINAADGAIKTFIVAAAPVCELLAIPSMGSSLQTYQSIDRVADGLLAAPKVPVGLARQAHDATVRTRVQVLAKHGVARSAVWQRLEAHWKPELASLDATQLKSAWSQATSAWWPKAWFARRAVTTRLMGVRRDGQRPPNAGVAELLVALQELNTEDRLLHTMQPDAEVLLSDSYSGLDTDWESLSQHERWASEFSDAVDQLAAGDFDRATALRSRLQPLVTEERMRLDPRGATGKSLLNYRDAWRALRQALDRIDQTARPVQPMAGPAGADGALERILGIQAGWRSAHRQLQPWCLWRSIRDQAIAHGLQHLVTDLESGVVSFESVENHFEFSYRHWWVKKIFDVDPVLRTFSSADHERKIREFKAADSRFQKLTERFIYATLSGRIPTRSPGVTVENSEMGRLLREMQRQRGHMPLRQLVQALPTLLPKLKPCLLMSPLSVAQYLDAQHTQFDLVVFDEASQIPVWEAVGAIARGKQLVVVGDPKQLPPTNFFNRASSDEGDTGEEIIEDLESILDECLAAGMNRLSLEWHYRSRHESLITFSNVTYYESSLITFPSPVTDDVAVRFQKVAGVYDRGGSRTNRIEAEAVVAGIRDHYLDAAKIDQTLGVVTFNQPQQALIEKLLDAERRQNDALDRAIALRAAEPLFIKNLENVQGDERDVIFFSPTYGADKAGKITMNFGPLNGEGGHRRLNVAISRAREAVVIYGTLLPSQIDLAKVRAAGVRDLKHYLEFALKGPRALVEQRTFTGLDPDSPFETAVIGKLRNRGWEIHPQVGCSGYRLDIGVVDPRAPGRYLAGVECDGRAYHSGATARDRDRLRQHVLESLGWHILRIWSTDWWRNPEGELDKIHGALQALLENAASGQDADLDLEPPVATEEASESGHGSEVAAGATAEESVEPEVGVALPLYTPARLPADPAGDFYAPGSNARIVEQIRKVVAQEGPVLDATVFRAVARAWGLERTGSRIVERLQSLIPRDLTVTREGQSTFYWPAGTDPAIWRSFRIAGSSEESRRHVVDVCVQELAALVVHVLHDAGSADREDIARAVCRVVGMARVPADAQARVEEVIAVLLQQGVLKVIGTGVGLNP